MRYTPILFLFLWAASAAGLPARDDYAALRARADSLHAACRFEEAAALYGRLLESETDPQRRNELQIRQLWAQNGSVFLQFSASPVPVNDRICSATDYLLYLPEPETTGWIPVPNPFVRHSPHPFAPVMPFTATADRICFSAPDKNGNWDLYVSERTGENTWSVPASLGPSVNSPGDEILPFLSSDGKTLWFASDGLFGMGGFDLYRCRYDEFSGSWGTPENLGFPYSSPADDLAFRHTPDGKYSILASNRNCPEGKVRLYALAFNRNPVRKAVGSPEEALRIVRLSNGTAPTSDTAHTTARRLLSPADSTGNSRYTQLVNRKRDLEAEMDRIEAKLQESRELYRRQNNENDRKFFREIIAEHEKELFRLRRESEDAAELIRSAELDFLARGIIPAPTAGTDGRHGIPESSILPAWVFSARSVSPVPDLDVRQPAPRFDYSFRILKRSLFAEDNRLPERLVYQIQLFTISGSASAGQFKGLTPVFRRETRTGKNIYSVGLFDTYAEASSCLPKVRSRGFRDAYIVAFLRGEPVSVKTARQMEGKAAASGASWQLVLSGYPDGLPENILSAIRSSCDKDLAKTVEDGIVLYLIGPFGQESEAEQVLRTLSSLGVEEIRTERLVSR